MVWSRYGVLKLFKLLWEKILICLVIVVFFLYKVIILRIGVVGFLVVKFLFNSVYFYFLRFNFLMFKILFSQLLVKDCLWEIKIKLFGKFCRVCLSFFLVLLLRWLVGLFRIKKLLGVSFKRVSLILVCFFLDKRFIGFWVLVVLMLVLVKCW